MKIPAGNPKNAPIRATWITAAIITPQSHPVTQLILSARLSAARMRLIARPYVVSTFRAIEDSNARRTTEKHDSASRTVFDQRSIGETILSRPARLPVKRGNYDE
jgi:hypothetical protein